MKLALTPACLFLPAGSYAISLVHRSQISGDHRQAGGRKPVQGGRHVGVMTTRLVGVGLASGPYAITAGRFTGGSECVDAQSMPDDGTRQGYHNGGTSFPPVSRPSAPGATNAGHTQGKDSMKTNPVPIRAKRQRTLEVVLAHQLDANAYALDGTPDALKQAQYHMRTAARLIDGYLGKKAA